MPADYWDRYGRRRTFCHRLPAAAKLLLTLGVVSAGLSTPVRYWPVHGVLAALVFMGHTLAQVPLRYLLRRVALFLPVVFAISLSLPISQGFTAGWEAMAAILFRSTLSFLAILWLISVMPFDQLLVTLRRFHVPAAFVAMLAFMYRYSFVVWDELTRMRTARLARGYRGGLLFRWKQSIQLIGLLLIRALGRAERVHGAMCARGWDGQVRCLEITKEPLAESPDANSKESPMTNSQ